MVLLDLERDEAILLVRIVHDYRRTGDIKKDDIYTRLFAKLVRLDTRKEE